MSTAASSGRRSQAKPPHRHQKTPSDCKATRDNISDATSQLRFKTRKAAGSSPRCAAQSGHQSVRARADYYHANARQGGAPGGGENDHARQARYAAIAPAGSLLHHAACRHAEAVRRDRAEIRGSRRWLHPHHPRRQPRRRQRQGGYPRAHRLRIQAQGKERKAKEGRNGGSKELSTPSQGNSQKPVPADRNGLFVCRSAGELAAAEWCVRQKEICLPLFPLHLRIAASGTKSKARRRRRMRRWSQAGNRKARPYGWRRVLGEPRPGRNIPWRRKMPRCPTSSATLCGRRARRDKAKDKK